MELNEKNSRTEIIEAFKNAHDKSEINLRTKKGHIYQVGGILNKLEGMDQSIAIDGKWVRV